VVAYVGISLVQKLSLWLQFSDCTKMCDLPRLGSQVHSALVYISSTLQFLLMNVCFFCGSKII
jgi:hypothetical protein